jgi:TolB-like protein
MRIRVVVSAVLALGILLVYSTFPASAQDLRKGVEQLAEQIIKSTPDKEQRRVAVVDFPDLQNVTSDLGRYIANRLTTRLGQSTKFLVIERQRLTQVLAELKLNMSDLVDPEKAKRFGQMVGVDAIVVGTVSDLGNQVDLDARIIEIETNRMILGETVTISKDQVVKDMLERGRDLPAMSSSTGGQPASQSAAQPSAQSPAPRKAVKFQEFPKLRVEVEELQTAPDGKIIVTLAYINKTKDELTIALNEPNPKTSLIDNAGHQYSFNSGRGLSGGWGGYWHQSSSFLTVLPGERILATLIFGGSRESGSTFHLNSEQLFVQKAADLNKSLPGAKFNIAIRNIEPKTQ